MLKQNHSLEYAKEIHNQLYGINKMMVWSWGANNFGALPEGPMFGDKHRRAALRFKVNGSKFKGYVTVNLMADDTYTVQFEKYKMGALREEHKMEDLYVDNFMDAIDRYVEKK